MNCRADGALIVLRVEVAAVVVVVAVVVVAAAGAGPDGAEVRDACCCIFVTKFMMCCELSSFASSVPRMSVMPTGGEGCLS